MIKVLAEVLKIVPNAHHVMTRDGQLEEKIKEFVEKNGLTEEEAHRYLQKRSMDNGTNMVETAYMVLQVF